MRQKPISLLKRYAALLKCYLRNKLLFKLSYADKILLDILDKLKATSVYKFEEASFSSYKFYFYKTDEIEIGITHYFSTEGVSLSFNNELIYNIRLDSKPIDRLLLRTDRKYGNYDVVKKYFDWINALSKP